MLALLMLGALGGAVVVAGKTAGPEGLSPLDREREKIHLQMERVEQELVQTLKEQTRTTLRLGKLRQLMSLQKQERELGKRRLIELSAYVRELDRRRQDLNQRVGEQEQSLRATLRGLHQRALDEASSRARLGWSTQGALAPEMEGPRQRVLARLSRIHLKDLEILQADLQDADALEITVRKEKQELDFLVQDLREQESVAEFHQKLESDVARHAQGARVQQLENLHRLREARKEVDQLITQFNARKELERVEALERSTAPGMFLGRFAHLKGSLPFPVEGQVATEFGRGLDPRTQLYVFRKGIEIQAPVHAPARAVADGRVVFAGALKGLGQIVIVDHGDRHYTLLGRLETILKRRGETVARGDVLGRVGPAEAGMTGPGRAYFEIRSGNVPVNPLQWLARSITF